MLAVVVLWCTFLPTFPLLRHLAMPLPPFLGMQLPLICQVSSPLDLKVVRTVRHPFPDENLGLKLSVGKRAKRRPITGSSPSGSHSGFPWLP